jgi:hypothetical protein
MQEVRSTMRLKRWSATQGNGDKQGTSIM